MFVSQSCRERLVQGHDPVLTLLQLRDPLVGRPDVWAAILGLNPTQRAETWSGLGGSGGHRELGYGGGVTIGAEWLSS